MKNILITITLLLVFTHSSEGQDLKTSLRNEVMATYGWYFQDVEHTDRDVPEWASRHELELRYKTNLKAVAEGRTVLNAHDSKRRRLWLNQAYIAFNKSNFYGKIGRQVVKWGNQTGWSWMDLANVYDYYDFLRTDNEALGTWTAEVKWKWNKWKLEMRVLPFRQYARLYMDQNRWTRLPTQFQGPNGESFTAQLLEKQVIDLPHPVSYGTTIGYGHNGTEIILKGFSGSNDIPQRSIELRTPDMNEKIMPYILQLYYHRINLGAISVNQLAGEYSLSAEIAYINNKRIDPTTSLYNDNYTALTLGVDRAFLFENPEMLLKGVIQYIRSFANDEAPYTFSDLDHVLNHCLLMDIDFQLNYQWKMAMRSILNFSNTSHHLNLSVQLKPSDKWTFTLDTDFLYGSKSHFFGHYLDNKRIFLAIKYFL